MLWQLDQKTKQVSELELRLRETFPVHTRLPGGTLLTFPDGTAANGM